MNSNEPWINISVKRKISKAKRFFVPAVCFCGLCGCMYVNEFACHVCGIFVQKGEKERKNEGGRVSLRDLISLTVRQNRDRVQKKQTEII